MLSVSIIIPTYNERDNIPPLLRAVGEKLAARAHEILVVDDDSPDGTGEAVRTLSKEIPTLKLLTKPRKEGIGAALRYGYDRARCDVIVSMDADLSFDPADIPRFLHRVEGGADLVIGSRHMPDGSYEADTLGIRLKKLVSALGNRVVGLLLGLKLRDCSANFRAIRRAVWEGLETHDRSNALLLEMILEASRRGRRIEEIPVTFQDRSHGSSKINLAVELPRYCLRLIVYICRYRLFRPRQ